MLKMKVFISFIVLTLFVTVCNAAPARFINSDAVEWLQTFGYLVEMSEESIDLPHYQSALAKMQKLYGIPVTRDIDLLTELQMLIPRCGVSDAVGKLEEDKAGQPETNLNIEKRYVTSNKKWEKDTISYRISSYTSDMPVNTQRAIVQAAFRIWGEVVPLTFYESTDAVVDTDIGFYFGHHDDNSPFSGNIIAHAFPPDSSVSASQISGDIHLNDAQQFSEDSNGDGFSFLSVMVHEIGHTLGLDHSWQKGAVMHESYDTITSLTDDDISGIQYIYGVSPSNDIESVPVDFRSPTPYDAIYYKDNAVHLIKNNHVFRQYPAGGSGQEYKLNDILPGRPEVIQSATVLSGEVIYIKDHQVWKYDSSSVLRESYPKSFWEMKLPEDVDMVFASPSENSLYFFKGSNYYQVVEGSNIASIPQPIASKFGPSVVGADAAFVYDTEIIFVQDTLCYSYDLKSSILSGPHDFSQDMNFTKCGSITLLISPILLMVTLVSRYIFM